MRLFPMATKVQFTHPLSHCPPAPPFVQLFHCPSAPPFVQLFHCPSARLCPAVWLSHCPHSLTDIARLEVWRVSFTWQKMQWFFMYILHISNLKYFSMRVFIQKVKSTECFLFGFHFGFGISNLSALSAVRLSVASVRFCHLKCWIFHVHLISWIMAVKCGQVGSVDDFVCAVQCRLRV